MLNRNDDADADPGPGPGEEDANTEQPEDDGPPEDITPGEQPDDGISGEEVEDLRAASTVEHFQTGLEFIATVKRATLDNTGLSPDIVHRLRNPIMDPFIIDDPDQRLSLELFLATQNASQHVYNSVRGAVQNRHPDASIHSLAQVKARLPVHTGVTSIANDMCINSCLAYTGPFANDASCRHCGEPRYDRLRSTPTKRIARQQFHTIPVGPVIQSLRRSPTASHRYDYLRSRFNRYETELPEVFDDFDTGSDFLHAVRKKKLTENDTVLFFSVDGAQLYRNKKSDCWIAIWVILNWAPTVRYLKESIFVAFTIPGPNHPVYYDSYLSPTLEHLSAVGKEGISLYDAAQKKVITDRPFLAYAGADRVALAPISGSAGHTAKYGCRNFCDVPGRHKEGASVYYPAFLKPENYAVPGSNHPDLHYHGDQMRPGARQTRSV